MPEPHVRRAALASQFATRVHAGPNSFLLDAKDIPQDNYRGMIDVLDTPNALRKRLELGRLFADACYDVGWVHEYCRDQWQVESVIRLAMYRSAGDLDGCIPLTDDQLTDKTTGTAGCENVHEWPQTDHGTTGP